MSATQPVTLARDCATASASANALLLQRPIDHAAYAQAVGVWARMVEQLQAALYPELRVEVA